MSWRDERLKGITTAAPEAATGHQFVVLACRRGGGALAG
jgi:hypothetical protein